MAGAALVGLAGCGTQTPSSSPAPPSAGSPAHPAHQSVRRHVFRAVPKHQPAAVEERGRGAVTAADGELPNGVAVFDNTYPAVTKLDQALLAALRSAATDAEADGIEFYVNSGWRSDRYQRELFQQAVSKYGSEANAAKWVAPPGTSAHEAGWAVDLGPATADAWLSEHGAAYGLCQIYRNEPWHFELRPDTREHGCPPMYADPSHDPRLQQ